MKSEGWYILGAIVFFIAVGFVLGFLIKGCTIPKSLPLPRVVHDTTYLPAPIINGSQTHNKPISDIKPIIPHDTVKIFPEFTYSDSIKGSQDSVDYKVTHTASFKKDSVKSVFDVEIKPFIKVITDSIWVPQIVLQNKPFLQDGWFYGSVGLFILSFLYLVGLL
jgi:hypothetical protein